ncbi:hypothetical protein MDUV_44540 [Mycolicibacterium duvalii]|uniref:Uncharacterized protein n=1 Tax=Mycolicibacterium duvalii TaxID=39688 RepID=A0A7I7K7N1_9MYCO|nr:hypothetical protein MDUV_44540 [Mycolicibacterium duvalii]
MRGQRKRHNCATANRHTSGRPRRTGGSPAADPADEVARSQWTAIRTRPANRPPWNGYATVMSPEDRIDAEQTADGQTDVPPANPAYSTPPPEGIPDADD